MWKWSSEKGLDLEKEKRAGGVGREHSSWKEQHVQWPRGRKWAPWLPGSERGPLCLQPSEALLWLPFGDIISTLSLSLLNEAICIEAYRTVSGIWQAWNKYQPLLLVILFLLSLLQKVSNSFSWEALAISVSHVVFLGLKMLCTQKKSIFPAYSSDL